MREVGVFDGPVAVYAKMLKCCFRRRRDSELVRTKKIGIHQETAPAFKDGFIGLKVPISSGPGSAFSGVLARVENQENSPVSNMEPQPDPIFVHKSAYTVYVLAIIGCTIVFLFLGHLHSQVLGS